MQLLNFLHTEGYDKRTFTTLFDQHTNNESQLKKQSMPKTQKLTFFLKKIVFFTDSFLNIIITCFINLLFDLIIKNSKFELVLAKLLSYKKRFTKNIPTFNIHYYKENFHNLKTI